LIIPDVNLLLYAYDSESEFHEGAKRWLEDLLENEPVVGFPLCVIFSFIRMITQPRIFRNPLTVEESAAEVRDWLDRTNANILFESQEHLSEVLGLLKDVGTAGNRVSDAQVAAFAKRNGATVHTTDNNFLRFESVACLNPILPQYRERFPQWA
jgi:toxin-antitoxin system PIN domain toxin